MGGFYSVWSINQFLKLVSNDYGSGILAMTSPKIIACFTDATLDPHLHSAAIGIMLGGLAPFILISLLEKYISKSNYYLVVDDHDDIDRISIRSINNINSS